MNLRLACAWVRQEMISRAVHRLAVGAERAAKEDDLYDEAVAEVDALLDPPEVDDADLVDPWTDPEWVAAMGGEMAGVS
jgi:hypothetical protein